MKLLRDLRKLRAKKPVLRDKARQDILSAANMQLDRSPFNVRVLTRKNIQEAVCIVRRKLLLSDGTLRAAGFNKVRVSPARRAEPWGGRSSYQPKKYVKKVHK